VIDRLRSWPKIDVAIFIIIFGCIGAVIIMFSSAADRSVSIETESGSVLLPATTQHDDPNSSASYVQFGSTVNSSTLKYVSAAGSDSANGTLQSPWRTIKKGLESIRSGETLVVGGGTYQERIVEPTIAAGSASQPIVVQAKSGEVVIIKGLLHLTGAHYWTIDGINVTWDSALVSDQNNHMIKMIDSAGWSWTRSELSFANAYSAFLISGGSAWKLTYNFLHDTIPVASHGTNQDHLVYISSGVGGGTIERNIFKGSPNGRGIKIGPPGPSSTPIGNVIVRYNTFYDNQGPSNIQLSYGASNNQIYRNIFVKSKTGYANVTAFNLNGTGNNVHDNIGWESTTVLQANVTGLSDGSGNIFTNPSLADPASNNFKPTSQTATSYGRFAP
jgi:Protein of unknown function (DUF1565)